MADLSDVLNAGRDLCGSVLYPSGGSGPAQGVGIPVLVAVGWPSPQSLDASIVNGAAQLTVYAPPGMHQNTTRGLDDDEELSVPVPTWTLTVSGRTITVGGQGATAYAVQNLAVVVNGQPFTTQTTGAGDTAASLAAALASAIGGQVAGTTVSGAVISVPASARIGQTAVGVVGTVYTEVKRQERLIQFTAWAPTPEARDAIIKAIDPVLGATTFLTLADQTGARLRWNDDRLNDFDQKQGIFRRDLLYTVEYATIQTQQATQIVAAQAGVNGQDVDFQGSGEIDFNGALQFGTFQQIITEV